MPSKAAGNDKEATFRKMLISADDYQRMGAAGIFENKPRVELLDGEIYIRSPLSPDHNGHVDKVSRFFNHQLFDKVIVRTQGSIRFDDYSEPEPDITILHFNENFYSDRQATAADVHLIIEVAVLSIKTDRTIKKKKYAAAGIPEYWIVIPEKEIVEVYRKPGEGSFCEKMTYGKGDEWVLDQFGLSIKGSDLLI